MGTYTDELQLCRTITLAHVTVRHFIVLNVCYYYYYYYYVVVVVVVVSCRGPFLPGTFLQSTAMPSAHASSFRLQYLLIMCDVASIAVFCSKSIKCLPGVASKCFFKLSLPF